MFNASVTAANMMLAGSVVPPITVAVMQTPVGANVSVALTSSAGVAIFSSSARLSPDTQLGEQVDHTAAHHTMV